MLPRGPHLERGAGGVLPALGDQPRRRLGEDEGEDGGGAGEAQRQEAQRAPGDEGAHEVCQEDADDDANLGVGACRPDSGASATGACI